MDEPPGATVSGWLVTVYGRMIRSLRSITNRTVNKEPKWRHRGTELESGYHPTTYARS
jgi:hydrogenase small subunit